MGNFHFGSSLNSISKLLRSKQLTFRGLYRGLGVACLFHAPALSIYLTTYDSSKLLLGRLIGQEWEETSAVFLASGFVAEVVSGVFWTPMEVVKQRMQVTALQENTFSQTSWQLARQTIKTEGFYGLYRGYGITLCVFVPYSMIYFTTYERMKVWRKDTLGLQSTKDLPFSSYLISSGLAGWQFDFYHKSYFASFSLHFSSFLSYSSALSSLSPFLFYF